MKHEESSSRRQYVLGETHFEIHARQATEGELCATVRGTRKAEKGGGVPVAVLEPARTRTEAVRISSAVKSTPRASLIPEK